MSNYNTKRSHLISEIRTMCFDDRMYQSADVYSKMRQALGDDDHFNFSSTTNSQLERITAELKQILSDS